MQSSFYRLSSLAAVCCLAFAVALTGCEPADTERTDVDTMAVDTTEMAAGENIVATLEADGRFSTLVTAIDSSGLASTLEGPGPFTLFAPTNQAFDALEEGSLEDLLAPANRQDLRDLLMNHVINGRRPATEVQGMTSVETMYGDDLDVRQEGANVRIGNATVTETDIEASNGVVHVIDAVLQPGDMEGEMDDDGMAPVEGDTL